MAAYTGLERRKHKRVNKIIGTNITCYNDKKSLPKLDEEVGLNLSEGGVLIECSQGLAKGARLKLKIMLTCDTKYKIIQAPAKIIWARKTFRKTYFLGCKFTRLSPKDRMVLRRFTASFQTT